MKRIINIILAVIFFVISYNVSYAQDNFEGIVKYKIVSAGEEVFMDFYRKGDDMRMDIKGEEEASMIFNKANILIMMPSQKMYMEFPADIMEKMNMNKKETDEDETGRGFEDIDKYRTGETKEILGHTCEKWFFSDEETETEVWFANDLGDFKFFENPMTGGGPSWYSKWNGTSYFPMSVVSKNKLNGTTEKIEVTELEEKNLSANLFKAPAGYTKMSMPMMPNNNYDK